MSRLGVTSHPARVVACEGATAVLECLGQTLRLSGLDARPGDCVQIRVDCQD